MSVTSLSARIRASRLAQLDPATPDSACGALIDAEESDVVVMSGLPARTPAALAAKAATIRLSLAAQCVSAGQMALIFSLLDDLEAAV